MVQLIRPESPALLRLFVEQTVVKAAEISAIPLAGKREKAQQYVSLAIEAVRLTDIRTDGGAEDNAFTETVPLQFAKIRYETFNHAAGEPNAPAVSADPKEKFECRWDMEHSRQWPSA